MADKKIKSPEEVEKEKKQLVFLGGLLGLAGLYFAFAGIIQPKLDTLSAQKEKIVEEKQKLELMQSEVKSANALDKLGLDTYEKIKFLEKNAFPPKENSLMWLLSFVGEVSEVCGVSIDDRSCRQLGVKRILSTNKNSLLEDYQFEVSIKSDVHTFGRFIGEVERRIPYCYITSVSIVKNDLKKISGSFRCHIPRLSKIGQAEFDKLGAYYVKKGEKK